MEELKSNILGLLRRKIQKLKNVLCAPSRGGGNVCSKRLDAGNTESWGIVWRKDPWNIFRPICR
jgi:hypothetical protein